MGANGSDTAWELPEGGAQSVGRNVGGGHAIKAIRAVSEIQARSDAEASAGDTVGRQLPPRDGVLI